MKLRKNAIYSSFERNKLKNKFNRRNARLIHGNLLNIIETKKTQVSGGAARVHGLNMPETAALPICRCSGSPSQSPAAYCAGIIKLTLKFMWRCRDPE